MSNDNSDDKTYSLSELEQKLRDAMEAVEILKKGGNINLGEDSVASQYEQLKKEFEKKSKDYQELDKQFQVLTQEVLELQQEKMMFEKFTDLTESEKEEMKQAQSSLETQQEKMFMEKELEIEIREKEKAKTKYYKAIIVSAIAIAVIAGATFFFTIPKVGIKKENISFEEYEEDYVARDKDKRAKKEDKNDDWIFS